MTLLHQLVGVFFYEQQHVVGKFIKRATPTSGILEVAIDYLFFCM